MQTPINPISGEWLPLLVQEHGIMENEALIFCKVMVMDKTAVVALGGNAILRPGQRGTYAEQMENIQASCQTLVQLVQDGYKLILTHGNGPQVGNLLIQNECTAQTIPIQPLHSCVAQTQGQLGYMIQSSLDNIFKQRGLTVRTATIVTRVLVDAKDPAFEAPSKPVGPFFSKEHAQARIECGETWMNDSGRGWRRMVPSPIPQEIVELEIIRNTFDQCAVTIAVGGGGIPVIENDNQLIGIDAVIDKDLASSLMARSLCIDSFIILTDVNNVKLNFGQPHEINLSELTVAEGERHIANGQFGVGSMAPKVQAALEFVKSTGHHALITSLTELGTALKGKAGTVIRP